MATTKQELLTADELLRLSSQGVRGELIRGVLCKTMSVGQEHGEIVVKLIIQLGNFIQTSRLGRLVASDSGVWLERNPDTVREPDIAFFSAEKVPPGVRLPATPRRYPIWWWKCILQATACEKSTIRPVCG